MLWSPPAGGRGTSVSDYGQAGPGESIDEFVDVLLRGTIHVQ